MKFSEFDALIGQNSYVRCDGKLRRDSAIVDFRTARKHVRNGGQIGWWVRSGYIVVDIDEGKQQAIKIVKALGLKTLMCKTPKGLHLYFKTEKDFPQRVGMVLPCGLKCDFRVAQKGYVLIPYGAQDRVFNKCRKIADMPLELTPMLGRKESLLGLAEGDGRNTLLFSHLMAYKNRGATDDQVEEMAELIDTYVFNEPMGKKERDKIVDNTKRYEAALQGENPYIIYTSKGVPAKINFRAIVDYFVNMGGIFVIGGECYQYQDGVYLEAGAYIRNTIKDMIVYDALISQRNIVEAYRLLIDDTRLQRNSNDLNYDKTLINFKNGVWDIKTNRLLEHDSKYLHTLQIPHEVKRRKPFKETRLAAFFKQCSLSREDQEMVLKFMAYCLTLDHGLKTFMIFCGQSNTGKSVLIRFFETLIGTHNTSALSMHELNKRFYPTQLYNKLMNACADNSSLPLSSIDSLKKITGGDQIMYEKKGNPNIFFFVPFAKLLFSFNQLPLQLEEKSNAFYKRMRILHMNKELFLNNDYVNALCSSEGVEEVIPFLLEYLPLKEIPRTKASNKLVEALRRDSDSIHAFLAKKCVQNSECTVEKEELFDAYYSYCCSLGREAHKKQSFMRNVRALGYKESRDAKSRRPCWVGLELKSKGRKGRR